MMHWPPAYKIKDFPIRLADSRMTNTWDTAGKARKCSPDKTKWKPIVLRVNLDIDFKLTLILHAIDLRFLYYYIQILNS